MIVVPVMDLRAGQCVHAKAGRRAEYRPLVSVLTQRAAEPLELAGAYHNRIGAESIYVADLDAILDDRPNWNLMKQLSKCGAAIWADVGVRTSARAVTAFEAGVETIVIGLETLTGPDSLREIVTGSRLPRDRCLLSLDLFDGRPLLAANHEWDAGTSLDDVVRVAVDLGLTRFLILDLAKVGIGQGVGGRAWVSRIAAIVPNGEIWLGGGVRDRQDFEELGRMPIAGVLVGSALHDGSIGCEDIAALARTGRRSPR